jgi:protoporphyrinogen oxidase
MNERIVIVGGGIAGMLAAYYLGKQHKQITLIERAPTMGGVLNSFEWQDCVCDLGCHLFGNDQNISTELILDIFDNEVVPLNVNVSSIFNGKLTDGYELPDLSQLAKTEISTILYELIERASIAQIGHHQSLKDLIITRYGSTVQQNLAQITQKMFGLDMAEIASSAFPATPFRRLKLLNEKSSLLLKQIPALDSLLATKNQSPAQPRAYYPKYGGVKSFVDKATQKLDDLKIDICLGTNIDYINFKAKTLSIHNKEIPFDRLIWAAGASNLSQHLDVPFDSDEMIHKTPMVLFYYKIKKALEGPYDYIHNYDEKPLFFRASQPGKYGVNNCPAGYSYICVECTTNTKSDIWSQPEKFVDKIWEELQELQFINQGQYDIFTIKQAPVSYKVPKLAYNGFIKKINQKISKYPWLYLSDEFAFTKGGIVMKLIEEIKQAS